ncbi:MULTISPECIES: prepilin-type N-terminal cleavage/methylation domain-containing protein [unclassified Mesotoga]|uniref:prepilin-type N-terminal cleavage/methylation domain-containing protein n=1 Tax=unclassified Mesotoga TaxID=1184398 RepID=UPI000C1A5156|nr:MULTISPECIES: prepilin-type N-terminal cleavage/methylation domain-containing protein [unclassified Mesotoga]PVD17031.1 N-terminal cleavage protein [Mesotoga sp. Brook.08.105.5.1]RAO95409.1 hypothetical protein M388_06780 [Mesotoga sp. Brook.08.YT.4.2.5.4.]
MKNRKRGFSLVELLIVLAVIAALIATITPVALNAIKKAKATQVAQNLKTLATALENAAYVNGVNDNKEIKGPDGNSKISIDDLARDLPKKDNDHLYGFAYTQSSGKYDVVVFYTGKDANAGSVKDVLNASDVGYTSTNLDEVNRSNFVDSGGATYEEETGYIYYYFDFTVY